MTIYLSLAFGALGLGAAYALQAIGIVVVFKTARVFNFASGGIATLSAYVAGTIAPGGSLVHRLIGLLAGVAVGALTGLVMEFTLRFSRSALNRTVVTLGWLLGLQGVVALLFGSRTDVAADPVVSGARLIHFDNDIYDLAKNQVLIIVVTLAVAAGLTLFFRATRLGVGMRAVADDPQAARLLGLKVRTIDQAAWLLGGAVAGLTGVLVTMLNSSSFDQLILIAFSIEALAAVLVARLTSLPLALAGGFILAIAQAVFGYKFISLSGTDELVSLAVILIALAFRRPTGRQDQAGAGLIPIAVPPLPTGNTAKAIGGGVLLVAAAVPLIVGKVNPVNTINIAQFAIWSLAILSLVLLTGVVGQISLCQGSFMGIGAFATGIAIGHSIPFLLAIVVGALVAGAAAMIVGLPALRLSPLELAIVTLSLAFTADYFLFAWPPLVSNGSGRPVPRPGFATTNPTAAAANPLAHVPPDRAYAWLCLGIFILVSIGVSALRRGRTGSALTALRSSPAATSAMGFSVTWAKLRGFALSGAIAGLAGGLYAGLSGLATGAPFMTLQSVSLLAFAVIAGVGSIPGAVLGGAIVTLSTIPVSSSSGVADPRGAALTTLVSGAVLVAIVLAAPTGVTGLGARLIAAARQRRTPPPPSSAVTAIDDRTPVTV